MKKGLLVWVAAIALMIIAVFFQRLTGPTYPKKVSIDLDDTLTVSLKLPRSHIVDEALRIELPPLSWDWTVYLYHRPYPVNGEWMQEPPFWPENGKLVSYLPAVPNKAAKLEYYIELSNITTGKVIKVPDKSPLIIRYKGAVPPWALVPHIILIFLAMIFSNLAGFMALFNDKRFKVWSFVTLSFIVLGGLIFGPFVQKFAFGHYWTGFPLGYDLTDNKTLIMFVFWLVAVLANIKKPNQKLTILAFVVTIIVYCIPHSLRGSEFNYQTGEVVTGLISVVKSLF